MTDEKTVAPLHNTLPGPISLAKEAWKIYKARFWIFAGIYVLSLLAYVGIAAVVGILGVLAFFVFGAEFASIPFIVTGGILFIIAILAMIYLSTLVQGAWVLAADGTEKIGVKETVKKARKFIAPMLLTGGLSAVLIMGGYFFLIIPGIILSIWFSLSQFVVVYDNQQNLQALHTSREYLRGKVFAVIWRWIAIYAPFIILGLVMGIATEENNAISGIINLLSLFAGPFYLIYGYVLFTHLKKLRGSSIEVVPQKSKLLYIGVPVLGYLLFIISAFLIVPSIVTAAQTFFAEQMKTAQQEQIGNPESIENGNMYELLLAYQEQNQQFPAELSELVDTLPTYADDGYEYLYMPSTDLEQFRLCMVTINGSESCTLYPPQATDPNTI